MERRIGSVGHAADVVRATDGRERLAGVDHVDRERSAGIQSADRSVERLRALKCEVQNRIAALEREGRDAAIVGPEGINAVDALVSERTSVPSAYR